TLVPIESSGGKKQVSGFSASCEVSRLLRLTLTSPEWSVCGGVRGWTTGGGATGCGVGLAGGLCAAANTEPRMSARQATSRRHHLRKVPPRPCAAGLEFGFEPHIPGIPSSKQPRAPVAGPNDRRWLSSRCYHVTRFSPIVKDNKLSALLFSPAFL